MKQINTSPHPIRTAHSCNTDARAAVRDFYEQVVQSDMTLVLFFCSSEYDLDELASELNTCFAGIQVIGCTTAGEIGPGGYLQHSLSGVSFSGCTAVSSVLEQVGMLDLTRGNDFVQSLLQRLERVAVKTDHSFAFMMVDGLCAHEEFLTHALQTALGHIPLFGGSAGDDLQFEWTGVFCDGRFHCDSLVLLLFSTPLPFTLFKTQHFVASDERMVVTQADAEKRVVSEINGVVAATEYARLVGTTVDALCPELFASFPLVVKMEGTDYVRSIQKANQDGSLTLYCAIEEGVVLRMAQGVDMLNNLEQMFHTVRDEIGPPQLVIGCDCILRNLELTQHGLKARAADIFRDNRTVGFCSYGEQFHNVHVNQTFTGVAIGYAPEAEECDV